MPTLILSEPNNAEEAPDSMSVRVQELKDYAADYERFSQVILERYSRDKRGVNSSEDNSEDNYDSHYTTTNFVDDCLQLLESLEKIARELFEIHQRDPIAPVDVIIDNTDVAISWYDLLLSDEFDAVAMDRPALLAAKQNLMNFKQTLDNVLSPTHRTTRPY